MAGTPLLSNNEAVAEVVLHMSGSKMARKIHWLTGQRKKLREINISYSNSETNRKKNRPLGLSPKLMYVNLYLVNNSFKAWALFPCPIFFTHERKRNTVKELYKRIYKILR